MWNRSVIKLVQANIYYFVIALTGVTPLLPFVETRVRVYQRCRIPHPEEWIGLSLWEVKCSSLHSRSLCCLILAQIPLWTSNGRTDLIFFTSSKVINSQEFEGFPLCFIWQICTTNILACWAPCLSLFVLLWWLILTTWTDHKG